MASARTKKRRRDRARSKVSNEVLEVRGTPKSNPTLAETGLDLRLHALPPGLIPDRLTERPPEIRAPLAPFDRIARKLHLDRGTGDNAKTQMNALDSLNKIGETSSGGKSDPARTYRLKSPTFSVPWLISE